MAARQFGHCSSDAVAIGRTAPHAAHRETVCLASMPPPRGASAGGRGGGDGVRGSGFELRYPCWRYLQSLMAGKCIVGGVPSPGSASLAAQSSFWSIPGMCATIPVLLTYLAATRLVAAPRVVSIVVSVLVGAASFVLATSAFGAIPLTHATVVPFAAVVCGVASLMVWRLPETAEIRERRDQAVHQAIPVGRVRRLPVQCGRVPLSRAPGPRPHGGSRVRRGHRLRRAGRAPDPARASGGRARDAGGRRLSPPRALAVA